uniref:Uncharacterized protein LOC117365124 isoform X2 n=1 Tax=Geotrypetes seraphini TaxID=260995 RepID=A0A6P8S1X6_GEOSA|nr:uncharacterized protein LOC117365124 isoform X2 [Geotrypetes seraphini]
MVCCAMAAHMDQILLCNNCAMKGAFRSILDEALEDHCNSEKSRGKLRQILSFVTDCICSIVMSSADSSFRRRCLRDMQVTDTQNFHTAIQNSLSRITNGKLLVRRTCGLRKLFYRLKSPGVEGVTKCILRMPPLSLLLLKSSAALPLLAQRPRQEAPWIPFRDRSPPPAEPQQRLDTQGFMEPEGIEIFRIPIGKKFLQHLPLKPGHFLRYVEQPMAKPQRSGQRFAGWALKIGPTKVQPLSFPSF